MDVLQQQSLFVGSRNSARSSRNTQLPKSIHISAWQCLCYYHIIFRGEDHGFHQIFIRIWDYLALDTSFSFDLPPVLGKIHCSFVVTPQLVSLPRQKPRRSEPLSQPRSLCRLALFTLGPNGTRQAAVPQLSSSFKISMPSFDMTIKVISNRRASSRHQNPLTVVYSTGIGLIPIILSSFGFPQ